MEFQYLHHVERKSHEVRNEGIIRARWCYHPWGFDLSMLMEAANLAAKSEQPVRQDALPR